ncbi:MAG: hypothetical protein Q8M19_19545 [Reyranella sp.]|nr:hypothetical protein [Reyranella sp.]
MALTAEALAAHPALHARLRHQARLLLDAYEANPRLSSVFATQQRWLMAHIALSLYFRGVTARERGGFTAARFFEAIARNGVASRNTADSFLKEMLKYDYARRLPGGMDRRSHPLEPTPASLDAIRGWLMVHLSTLDNFDGGQRLATFLDTQDSASILHPLVADGLLSSRRIREPSGTFSLFTWLDNGGIVMDWLIAGMEEAPAGTERIPTGIVSVAAMAEWLKLSRTHLARKLRDAEELGSLGWLGKRGHSVMWVSDRFRREYEATQAAKLAIVDHAFDAGFCASASAATSQGTETPLKNGQRLGATAN